MDANQMSEEDIIKKLSEIHFGRSTDPECLCSSTFREFDPDHPDYPQYPTLQGRLFTLCNRRGDAWTQI